MWKTVLAGTTALAIAGASFAFADQGQGRPDRMQEMQGWRPSAADITAFADARIAALHAGLKLSADQEKNWPVVEGALRDMAKQRADRIEAFRNAQGSSDPIERLSRRADAMQGRGAALKKLAEAAGPLYKSLDEAQKHRFVVLAHMARPHVGRWGGHHGWRGRENWRDQSPRGPEGGAPPQ